MQKTKEDLMELLEKLTENQIEYIYELTTLLFCQTAD